MATDFSGYRDFCDADTAFLCRFTPGPLLGTNGGTFIGALPDPADFCQQVERVLADYRAAVVVGLKASVRVRAEVSWDRVGTQLTAMLAAVGGATLPSGPEEDTRWQIP